MTDPSPSRPITLDLESSDAGVMERLFLLEAVTPSSVGKYDAITAATEPVLPVRRAHTPLRSPRIEYGGGTDRDHPMAVSRRHTVNTP